MKFRGFVDHNREWGPVAEFEGYGWHIPGVFPRKHPVWNKKSLIQRRDNLKKAGHDYSEEEMVLNKWPEEKKK